MKAQAQLDKLRRAHAQRRIAEDDSLIPFRFYAVDEDGRRTYHEPTEDELAIFNRQAESIALSRRIRADYSQ